MLNDAVPSNFAGIYLVCGYTDLRYGIDSLASIIERRYKVNLFVPNTLFLFCGRSSKKIKGLLCAYSASTEHGFRKHLNSHSGYI